ncbi:D-psicose 3-epimerase [Thiocystis violacea]|uniref:D-psicose 3-epimerase n=1 Tax=Thiocystis violacea TaxID=13725 RepID=UPI00190341F5|nr:sugar phosphate isomerase/epimerase family protein [Thiocystis violacea]MBK1723999.1 xylose isomerase [Thiocystis violacea]
MRNIGIYYAYWTQEWDVDFIPYIKKVKKLGFDQLEINGGTIAVMTSGERAVLREEAQREGIVLSYGIGLTPQNNVSSLDENIRRTGVNFMKEMIKGVADMGGGCIGGTVHSFWPATDLESIEQKKLILDQSLKSMREMIPLAEDLGVILSVEVINRFEQYLLNTCAEAVSYVEEIDSPNCKILLDTFHMNIEEDSIGGAIELAGSYLSQLHVGENNRKPPGTGRMDWGEIKTALDNINFDGPIVMEPFVRPGGTVGKNIAVWRDLMPGADLDEAAAQSVQFLRDTLCS